MIPRRLIFSGNLIKKARSLHSLSSSPKHSPQFGIFFDIDGVIVRGKNVLPFAPHAFRRLVDTHGKFRVPTVFVTNACNTMRKTKADQLSKWLGVEVDEEQVVMSHSPLKMFKPYHTKHVLVIGQGPVDDIARNLGFKKVTTMTQLRHAFPTLDNVDHKRRRGKYKPEYKKPRGTIGEQKNWFFSQCIFFQRRKNIFIRKF